MTALIAVLGLAGMVLALQLGLPWYRAYRRRRLRASGIAPQWRAILMRRAPLYRRLPAELRPRLDELVGVFVAEKDFVGCAGLEVTLPMKLGIAAQACLLIVNRSDCRVYDELSSILVYPAAFLVPDTDVDEAGVVTEERRELIGQTFDTGRIVLSWADVAEGARGAADGVNVVLHEFAHYLDHEQGTTNGALRFGTRSDRERFTRVLRSAYARLWHRARRGRASVIDDYALEDEGEFFAVATEAFFEQPEALRAEDAELYSELARFYALDPASWPQTIGDPSASS
jgi:Mlc titration factor MtfA (ptsG expression regulator)